MIEKLSSVSSLMSSFKVIEFFGGCKTYRKSERLEMCESFDMKDVLQWGVEMTNRVRT